MIRVQLNKPGFEYDIHSLVKAFFPSETVSVGLTGPQEGDETTLYIITDYLETSIEISFFDPAHGQKEPVEKRCVEADFSDRRETKNRLKQAYYKMLSAYAKKELPWGSLTGIRPTKIPMRFLAEGRDEAFIRRYMKETYFASDAKIDLSIAIAKRERKLLADMDCQNGYSLYIGIPFCPCTCLYCSFPSYPIAAWAGRVDAYLDALEKEMQFAGDFFGGRKLNTVYVGGGTPTTLEPAQLRRLLHGIRAYFDLSGCLEVTVEAGRPDSITREKLEVLREEGISRISINPQTMNEKTLRLIGRRHTPEQAVQSFWLAREMGFDNINMDLILGLPDETLSDVEYTMRCVSGLSPDNLTVHSLALKRAARLTIEKEAYRAYAFQNTDETIALTADYAGRLGMKPYYLYRQKNMAGNFENVGYAKPGKAGIYNILVMEEVQDIVALGAGSISKRVYPDGSVRRCENVKEVALYMEKIDEMTLRKRRLFMTT